MSGNENFSTFWIIYKTYNKTHSHTQVRRVGEAIIWFKALILMLIIISLLGIIAHKSGTV